ncbi:2-oxo-4-hydroxy-4-carboxy-5-ureidoimidazoline decarboxylase [Nocardia sp. CS682]|uniref:2-oxo-4-hydroxy-4-carboxy-5-ureidoimidazoline decarboxylase n=1 Tax=Nocardia sp. CS682 TaxID=1047172 RepID=UPI0010756095|nr:2-oxo-4-hydroxy-4-carboxy-5-ureidoimidazoline decarboxylase [Nocardia sp. CS682]QBS45946.1 2-oxo-4-hydroxy-4-carboxy-5-ureidoimidazoline decarboxylase [Nocardia sp. CS682]
MTDDGAGLAGFNALPANVATKALLTCCSSLGWARALVEGRPYPSVDAVLDTADAVLAELPESEIDRALAGHPRIGERPDTAASAREQAGVATAADAVRSALAAGNRAYEARFGYRYLVCASGRSGSELLAILEDRLGNDAETERRVMRTELAKINRIRLRALLAATR